jgi:DNA-binding response OmpR family regulator
MSVPHPDRRNEPDRRRQPRGGRRAGDQEGLAPLILLADPDSGSGNLCEAILAKLRFGVARVGGADEALRVMGTLRPDLIIARGSGIERLAAVLQDGGLAVPLIILRDEPAGTVGPDDPPADGYLAGPPTPTALIQAIRRVLGRKGAASM